MATVTVLPLDLKGTLSSNKRLNEPHTLTKIKNKVNRVLIPDFGMFYSDETLQVRTSSGVALKAGVDYVATYYYRDLGELTAKPVDAMIVVINPLVENTVTVTYQAVGGPYGLSVKELKALLEELENNPTKIDFDDIINKPLMYNPANHTHEYWQLYGMESTVENLDLLGDSLIQGNHAVIDMNRLYYKRYVQIAKDAVTNYRTLVNAHITNMSNPHKSDKVKIQLGNLNNWSLATTAETINSTINNKYMPIGGVFNQITSFAVPKLTAHIADKNNPHRLQLNDPLLDLYSKTEIDNLFSRKLRRDQTAKNSTLLNSLSQANVYDAIRASLNTSNIDPTTRLPYAAYATAPGADTSEFTLVGTQRSRSVPELIKQFGGGGGQGIYFVGNAGNINSRPSGIAKIETYGWVPAGTWVIGAYSCLWFSGGRVPVYTPFIIVGRRNTNTVAPYFDILL